MSISTIYGVNGVGKDTVALELARHEADITLTSESRALMYVLGIITHYDTKVKIGRDQYVKLENTPQSHMKKVTETDYKDFVRELQANVNRTIMLSHLVFALYLDKEITYLTDKDVPEWYIESNNALIQLTAPAEVIYERRAREHNVRDRGNFSISDIENHQHLCDVQWTRVSRYAGQLAIPAVTIENNNLQTTVCHVNEVLNADKV